MRDPAGGQFERERHAVQTAADACHRQCGRRVKPKSWRCAPRTFQEQLDRLPAGQAGRIGGKVQIWQLKGRNSPDHLAGQAKRLAARDEHGQARTAFQQRHDQVGARPEQVLAVVQQHHHRPVSELVHQGRRGRPGTGQRQAQRRRGRRRHQPPVPDAGQLNEPYAVRGRIGTREAACGLDPQPGLADPAGPGGIGKTRLGIETARRLASPDAAPDGVWLVELSGVRDGRLVPAAAAASLGLALTGARPTTAALVNQLADRTMVVLLDNCEHLLGACADLVMALLERCPGLTVLITSREPLRLPGEVVWRVPSLELPDLDLAADPARLAGRESVQLFLERARSASPAFRLDASTALPVARICCRLDGMPLALELAACRVAHLAPAELAARLDDALVTLAGRIRGVPDRQATLAATLDWSHDLLADIERAAFRRLSVFAGGLTLDAAEAVCGDGLSEPVATVIWRLVDKSLVAADTAGDQARFRLLEVVRQYAAARLDSSGELAERQRRHALWFAGRAESLDPDVGGGLVGEPSPWFGVEGGNLRVALWTLLREMPDRALVTAVAMWRSWMARGLHAEGLRWLTQALDACPAASPLRARALFATAVFEIRLGRLWRAGDIGAEITTLGQQLGDPHGVAEALHQHTLLAWLSGEWEQADRLARQASAAARQIASVRASHRS